MKQTIEDHAKALKHMVTYIKKECAYMDILNKRHDKMKRDYAEYQRQYDVAVQKGRKSFERKE